MVVQEFGVVSYTLLLSLIEYKTLVLREDMEAAQQLLPSIPKVRVAVSQLQAAVSRATAYGCHYTDYAMLHDASTGLVC